MEPSGASGLRRKSSRQARISVDVQNIMRDAAIFQALESPEGEPANCLNVNESNNSEPFALPSDVCRICLSEATPEKPLYHPCICRGSIRLVHEECLLQWLKHSGKNYCDVCYHRFSFRLVYSSDMPARLPIKDILSGLLQRLCTAVRFLLHYTLVAIAWLRIVPLAACRIYRCLFTGSFIPILSLPLDILSTENLFSDSLCGCCVIMCTWCAFLSVVGFTIEILYGGGPEWLDTENNIINQPIAFANNNVQANAPQAGVPDNLWNEGNNGALAVVNGWFHPGEQVRWKRYLGLDGSFVFLRRVCWIILLNTLFIIVFAFCPYKVGQFAISSFGFEKYTTVPEFEGLLTALFGYINIGTALALLHGAAAFSRLRLTRRFIGICYVVIKVSLFTVISMGIFPLMFGWCIDIFSLTMLDATIHDRRAGFKLAPGMSMFIHWLVGMIYVFHFQSFLLLLREDLQLSVLSHLNDPDFNPLKEMIRSPVLRNFKKDMRTVAKCVTSIFLMVWLPARIIEKISPGFLPYHLKLHSILPYSGSLDLMLLVLVLPAPLQQRHMKQCLKFFIRTWYIGMSCIIDIRPGDVNNEQKLCQIFFICVTLTIGSLMMITVPVFVGRKLMSLWFGNAKVYELYTTGCGLCACWFMLRTFTLMRSWIPRGWPIVSAKLKEWLRICFKMLCAMSVLLGLIPILMGLLLTVPSRVSLNQTPLISLYQDWTVGALLTIIFCVTVLVGPNWWMKRLIVQVYLGGIHNINLHAILMDMALPVIIVVGLSLLVPYIIACSIIRMFSASVELELQNIVLRRIYPALLACVLTVCGTVFTLRQLYYLYENIKKEKYLVGKRLVNYEHR